MRRQNTFVAQITGPRFAFFWLAVILLVGGVFRFTGLNWDDGQHLHPDERFITMVTNDITWPESFDTYFDPVQSPLSPYQRENVNYVYGTFPLFLTKWVAVQLDYQGYDKVFLVGRALSGVFDLASILFLFLIGRRLYDHRVGLLAAALYALCVHPIQLSHFYAMDTFANFFVVGVVYFAVRASEDGDWWNYALIGVLLGMGMASKMSVLTLGAAILVAAGLDMFRFSLKHHDPDRALGRMVVQLATVGILALLVFRVLQPIAFEGPSFANFRLFDRWVGQMKEMSEIVAGDRDIPAFIQWTGRIPIWFGWKNMVVWGMGVPLGLAAWAGWLLACYELLKKRNLNHLILASYVGIAFLYHGTRWVMYMRYFLPVYPFLVLFAAYLLVWVGQRAWGKHTDETSGYRVWYAEHRPEKPARGRTLAKFAAVLFGLVVVGGTFLYAMAFTEIYRHPHSRIQASRWIYANIPPGSVLTSEHWDDSLPLRIDGKDGFAGMYTNVTMENYEMDSREKLDKLVNNLQRADYVILSSNRLYDSIPRIPSRYPMTIRYYDYLFDERLGFRKVAEFTSYPRLAGIELPDQSADESFSVYDHPKVTIFKKTDEFDPDEVRALLGNGIEWENIMYMLPKQSAKVKDRLLLSPLDRARYEQAGTWSALFDRASWINRAPLVAWVLALVLLSVAAVPLTFVVFAYLADRGYILARAFGLLLVSWLVWLLASVNLAPFSRVTILATLAGVILLSAVVAWSKRDEMQQFFATRWRIVLTQEVVFWGLFALFVLIRWQNPDLWHPSRGGEKPMDVAYLNAVIKSPAFPPYDPWFAGGYINYYYFGFVLVATLIKGTGVVPAVAYNLAVPTLFAMTGAGAFAVVFNLVEGWRDPWQRPVDAAATSSARRRRSSRGGGLLAFLQRRVPTGSRKSPGTQPSVSRWKAGWKHALAMGVLGMLFVAVVGNLGEVRLIYDGLRDLSTLEEPPDTPVVREIAHAADGLNQLLTTERRLDFRLEWWYWNATRVIPHPPDEPGPINEFPFFTFLYADLHAHMMGLPYVLLVLALLVNLLREPDTPTSPGKGEEDTGDYHQTDSRVWRGVRREGPVLLALALVVGALWPTNTWDVPTYTALLGAVLLIRAVLTNRGLDLACFWDAGWRWVLVVGVGYGLFLPFHRHYANAYTGAERWEGSRTPMDAYLTMHGLFLFVVVTYLLVELLRGSGHNAVVRSVRIVLRHWWRLWRFSRLSERCVQLSLGATLLWYAALFGVTLAVMLAMLGSGVLAMVVVLVVLAGLLLMSDAPDPRRQGVLCFIGLALALTGVVELVVLKGDIGRMNTVFKFYMHVWVLWGVASAATLPLIAVRLRQLRTRGWLWQLVVPAWWGGFGLLLAACLLYPIFATPARIHDRVVPEAAATLNGLAYMEPATYADQGQEFALKWDYEAIQWLQQHVEGSPAIVEAQTPLYRWGSRVSVATGLPTLIGWDWHQRQQRAVLPGHLVEQRTHILNVIYNTPDPAEAFSLLHQHRIAYVYIGPLERIYYAGDGLDKFVQHQGDYWNLAYENPGVSIYRVGSGTSEQP